MPARRGLTPADLRAALQLSHSLHTSVDNGGRKQLLLARASDLLASSSAVNVVAHVQPLRKRHTVVSVTYHGADRLREDRLLTWCIPKTDLLSCRLRPIDPLVPQWHHAGPSSKASASRRLNHCMWCVAPVSEARVVACLGFVRDANSARPFSARDRLLLHLIHTEMSWIYTPDLILATRGAESLSPRQRQTLQYLLAGKSEKEIAEKMQLSKNTVHHHVKAIHRHFRVCSRSELLARWVR